MARMAAEEEIRNYEQAKSMRAPRENEFRLASAYCLPEHYGMWQTDGPVNIGTSGQQAVRRTVFDSTGARALPKYASVLERLATPNGNRYQGLTSSDKALNRIKRVKEYFDTLTDLLFKMRNSPVSRFRIATSEMYSSLGAYGTGPIFIGNRKPNPLYNQRAIVYTGVLLRDMFILMNDYGEVVAIYRRFYLNPRMFIGMFPQSPIPKCFMGTGNQSESAFREFLHCVRVRTDYDPGALDARRHPIVGSYINVADKEYVEEEHGFRSFPYLAPRTSTVSGDPYGFSPASRVLSALGGASATKKTYLKQGQKAVDPVLLGYDDGVLNGEMDLRPGAYNPGGVDSQGRVLVRALDTGNFQVAEKLMEYDRGDIEDSFFVPLFQILSETPEMTATEVIERVAEKTALLAPTMGRLQSEFLGPCTQREIDLLAEMGMLPDMPPELIEAKGDYEIQYTSPMAKGVHAEETAGFSRTVELAIGVAQATGNAEPLDHFDFDVAIPEIADNQAVPARWMKDVKRVQAERDQRAQQAEQAQLIQNAGGLAQAGKVAAEAGQNDNIGRKRAL